MHLELRMQVTPDFSARHRKAKVPNALSSYDEQMQQHKSKLSFHQRGLSIGHGEVETVNHLGRCKIATFTKIGTFFIYVKVHRALNTKVEFETSTFPWIFCFHVLSELKPEYDGVPWVEQTRGCD